LRRTVRLETLGSAEVFRRRVATAMSRTPSVPSYRLHKQSGQAIVTLTDGLGNRRDVLLGKHGTPESRLEYSRVIAEWEASGRRLVKPGPVLAATVAISYSFSSVEAGQRRPARCRSFRPTVYPRPGAAARILQRFFLTVTVCGAG